MEQKEILNDENLNAVSGGTLWMGASWDGAGEIRNVYIQQLKEQYYGASKSDAGVLRYYEKMLNRVADCMDPAERMALASGLYQGVCTSGFEDLGRRARMREILEEVYDLVKLWSK